MIRAMALLGAVFASSAWSQYMGLATPYDGSVVYFSSDLTLKGTNEPIWGKLFAADQNGVRLVRSLPEVIPTSRGSCLLGGYYDFGGAETTADGTSILAPGFVAATEECRYMATFASYLISPAGDRQFPGTARISPNGQFAITNTTDSPFSSLEAAFVDPVTGKQTPIKMPMLFNWGEIGFATGRTIANNGTAIFTPQQAYTVGPGSDPQPFPVPNVPLLAIDASGVKVLYATSGSYVDPSSGGTATYGPTSLRLFDLQTHEDDLVLEGMADPADTSHEFGFAAMTDDATRLLLFRGSQAWVVQSDGSGLRQLTNDPAGIADATMSGNGKVVYATTLAGRLLEINADTGDQVELVGRTPYFLAYQGQDLTPGTPGTVYLSGLPDVMASASYPPGMSLANTTVTVAGQAAPVLNVTPDHIDFLVPWNVVSSSDLAPVLTSLAVGVSGESTPFDIPQIRVVFEYYPTVAGIAHQDWSGPVTDTSPAHAGEILHFFMVGLGAAVNPEVPPGVAAPSTEPLARLATPLLCDGQQVLYAGLAPGETWRVYQVDLKLGSQTGPMMSLSCSANGGETWFSTSYFAILA